MRSRWKWTGSWRGMTVVDQRIARQRNPPDAQAAYRIDAEKGMELVQAHASLFASCRVVILGTSGKVSQISANVLRHCA